MKVLRFIPAVVFYFLQMQIASGSNYYWVGGSGNWKDYANHWATTSGGSVFHVHAPTLVDNVYFDVNSFTAPGQTVTIDTSTAYCWDMNWTGVTNSPTFNAVNTSVQLKAYGSLTLDSTMDFAFNGSLLFSAVSAGKTIATSGRTLPCSIVFYGPGGEWTLQDSLTTTKDITLTYGTLRTNNHNVKSLYLNSTNTNARALYLGTSTVTLTGAQDGPGYVWQSAWAVSRSLILDADSSIIRIQSSARFYSEDLSYNVIEWKTYISIYLYTVQMKMYSDSIKIKKVICDITSNNYSYVSLSLEALNHSSIEIDTIISNVQTGVIGSGNNIQYFYSSTGVSVGNDHWDDLNSTVNTIVSGGSVWLRGADVDVITAGGGITTSDYWTTENVTNTIGIITAGGSAVLNGITSIRSMTVSGNVDFTGIIDADTCRIYGNCNFLDHDSHFGMLTLKEGNTFTFAAGKTQTIDSLIFLSNPGFPTQLFSSDIGIPANVVINSPLCADYLYIQAVHASGNALYVGANSVDIANNAGWIFAPCVPLITYSISGAIITGTGIPVPGVIVTLSGDDIQTTTTGTNGLYNFTVGQGGNYTVTPSKNNDVATNNGITSIDILLTRRHILGTPLNTPYKIIAADVDSSNSVSTLDILLMRSMILQSISTFPNGRLWTFVPSDYVFADQLNPFPFPVSRSYSNLSGSLANQDFIGIKLGDVNNSWDANIP